jgi:CRP/FNR family transcriptional regulator
MTDVNKTLAHLNPELVSEISEAAEVRYIQQGTTILRDGQYVKVIPIVTKGLIKVFSRYQDKELLLYYIQPGESCIMSFAASLRNEPSKVYAVTEEDTRAILLPVDQVANWIRQYPDINTLFYKQYNLRYADLLDTINHILFNKLDIRIYDYLQKKKQLTNQNPLKISHSQIANELGTVREVVSRVLKKLENEGKVIQHSNQIELL